MPAGPLCCWWGSKVHLQTCNLTYWEVSQQMYVRTYYGPVSSVRGQNSALQWWRWGGWCDRKWVWPEIHPFTGGGGGRRGEGGGSEKGFWKIPHRRFSRRQIPSDILHCLLPWNTFLTRTYYIHQIQALKVSLKNRSFGCPCVSMDILAETGRFQRLIGVFSISANFGHCLDKVRIKVCGYLAINEWGWVGYDELSGSRSA